MEYWKSFWKYQFMFEKVFPDYMIYRCWAKWLGEHLCSLQITLRNSFNKTWSTDQSSISGLRLGLSCIWLDGTITMILHDISELYNLVNMCIYATMKKTKVQSFISSIVQGGISGMDFWHGFVLRFYIFLGWKQSGFVVQVL